MPSITESLINPWVAPGSERESPPVNFVPPSLTVTASGSAPISAPFQTPFNPPSGIRMMATIANRWGNNNNWLWAAATRNHDTFTGFHYDTNSNSGETTVWRGFFRYAGVMKLISSIWNLSTVTLRMYVSDDSNTTPKKFYDSTSAPASPYTFSTFSDATSITFTTGKVYQLKITAQTTGVSNCRVTCDMLAIETANSYSWPTLAAFTDASTPSAADFATISTAQNYLYSIIGQPCGSSCRVTPATNGTVMFYNGGFFLRGRDTSTKQITLNVRYRAQNGTTTLYTYAAGSSVAIDTITLTADATERNDSYSLTAASYSINTFYRIAVESSSAATVYVDRITLGGFIQLSSPFVKAAHQDSVNAASMRPIGGSASTDNLTEIRNAVRGTATSLGLEADKGFQMLCPDTTLGTVTIDAALVTSYQFTTANGGARDHFWRYLYYKSASGGTLTIGSQSISLASTSTATAKGYQWAAYDLNQSQSIAYGQTYTLANVDACFESIT